MPKSKLPKAERPKAKRTGAKVARARPPGARLPAAERPGAKRPEARPPRTRAAAPPARTAWETNCMFCGDALPDEGVAFLDHMALRPDCHEAYDHWREELDHDRPGG